MQKAFILYIFKKVKKKNKFQVRKSQEKLTLDFNGKICDVYTNMNDKFEALSTHVKKLETRMVQT